MKNRLMVILLLLVLTVFLGGCAQDKPATREGYRPTVKKMVTTYVQAPLNVPSIVAKERMSYEEVYKRWDLPFAYANLTTGAEQTAALASGDIQILNCVGASSVLISAANGADIKILSVYGTAPQAFQLYSRDKELNSPQSLKGKTIAGPKGTILHELLAAYLHKGGLRMEDVKFVSMSLPGSRAALEAGKVDAALQPGPMGYTAAKAGLHLVTNGEGLVSGLTVTATSKKFYDANKPLVEAFLQVQQDTLKYMQEHRAEVLEMTVKATQLSPEAVESMYPFYDFSPAVTEQTKQNLAKTQDFLWQSGMLSKKVDVESLFLK